MDTENTQQAPTGRVCPECGKTFHSTHHSKKFCTEAHRLAFKNRSKARGQGLVPMMQAWRLKRGSGPLGKAAFAELCQILDALNAEDREEKRPPATVYAAAMLDSGYTWRDRQAWQADARWRHGAGGASETGTA